MSKTLTIKRYLDAANITDIDVLAKHPWLSGITTNPSLVAKAGVENYEAFAKNLLNAYPWLDISFEVIADDIEGMIEQAHTIQTWGEQVWIKVPIVNSQGQSMTPVIEQLSKEGMCLNITAIYMPQQVEDALSALDKNAQALISVFAGRIADLGQDPLPIVRDMRQLIPRGPVKLLWASTREAYNIIQAQEAGCDIITAPRSILEKAENFGSKDLLQCSVDTVRAFVRDAQDSGLSV